MKPESQLTISDYYKAIKTPKVRDREPSLLKFDGISQQTDFSDIFLSCMKGEKEEESGLTAADYLSNPVKLNTRGMIKCMQASLAGKTNQMTPLSWKPNILDNSFEEVEEEQVETPDVYSNSAIERSINKAAQKYDLPDELIRGVIKAESGFQVRAESRAGARGLMQLMPDTARELGVKDVFDVEQNIDGGTRYLKKMMDRFDNDIEKALAAYNAGPGTVERYGGKVPYKETSQYVKRVLKYSGMTA
ncbi:Soluble lytic murein transglycosylase [uncultured Desulfobacterium sp.]|uniref:Soluble lytic murein transglycosylase n=1 Tax=uncultured Desulfobacterium sp. TaxID=201089 RepID=A0A445MX16_9BACT|nr:Soluble lytic murein transglycosylase [uncultured Desulfobacterium sp.]